MSGQALLESAASVTLFCLAHVSEQSLVLHKRPDQHLELQQTLILHPLLITVSQITPLVETFHPIRDQNSFPQTR